MKQLMESLKLLSTMASRAQVDLDTHIACINAKKVLETFIMAKAQETAKDNTEKTDTKESGSPVTKLNRQARRALEKQTGKQEVVNSKTEKNKSAAGSSANKA